MIDQLDSEVNRIVHEAFEDFVDVKAYPHIASERARIERLMKVAAWKVYALGVNRGLEQGKSIFERKPAAKRRTPNHDH